MSRARDAFVSALVLLLGRGRRRPRKQSLRLVPELPPSPGAETVATALLFVGALCAVAFVVVYALDSLPDQTQLLGVSLGLALLAVAGALIVAGKRLVVTEELVDEYPPVEHPHEQELLAQLVAESDDRLTRRRFFKLGLGAAGGALGLAAIAPALSFGPLLRVEPFYRTAWRRGRRLVDEVGRPWRASDIVCPCHYSTFGPADGGSVLFGPAGRRLPMLPIEVDHSGHLRAKGNFDDAVGPSWWGVRNRSPSP